METSLVILRNEPNDKIEVLKLSPSQYEIRRWGRERVGYELEEASIVLEKHEMVQFVDKMLDELLVGQNQNAVQVAKNVLSEIKK